MNQIKPLKASTANRLKVYAKKERKKLLFSFLLYFGKTCGEIGNLKGVF